MPFCFSKTVYNVIWLILHSTDLTQLNVTSSPHWSYKATLHRWWVAVADGERLEYFSNIISRKKNYLPACNNRWWRCLCVCVLSQQSSVALCPVHFLALSLRKMSPRCWGICSDKYLNYPDWNYLLWFALFLLVSTPLRGNAAVSKGNLRTRWSRNASWCGVWRERWPYSFLFKALIHRAAKKLL